MKQLPETLGERIRVALDHAGLSQTKAANLFGVDRNTVGLWIKGADVPERQLTKIVQATGRSAAWFRYGVADEGVAVERYVTGFVDGRERAIELISRMEPEPEKVLGVEAADVKPPREVAREAVPFGSNHAAQKNPKQA